MWNENLHINEFHVATNVSCSASRHKDFVFTHILFPLMVSMSMFSFNPGNVLNSLMTKLADFMKYCGIWDFLQMSLQSVHMYSQNTTWRKQGIWKL